MDLILIPGFWLDASSWDDVVPGLEHAGHRVHPLTLPGMQAKDADRSGITLRDHVDAVVTEIDDITGETGGSVVLVGHSGGGAEAYAAADARPDKVARVVYVDAFPLGEGGVINDELPVVDGEVPLPDWSVFEAEDLIDLDDTLRAAFRARAVPTPVRVTSDRQQLSDERRYDVPATIIACEFSADQVRAWAAKGAIPELTRIKDVSYLELPTGHWPQFTKPAELAQTINTAVANA